MSATTGRDRQGCRPPSELEDRLPALIIVEGMDEGSVLVPSVPSTPKPGASARPDLGGIGPMKLGVPATTAPSNKGEIDREAVSSTRQPQAPLGPGSPNTLTRNTARDRAGNLRWFGPLQDLEHLFQARNGDRLVDNRWLNPG